MTTVPRWKITQCQHHPHPKDYLVILMLPWYFRVPRADYPSSWEWIRVPQRPKAAWAGQKTHSASKRSWAESITKRAIAINHGTHRTSTRQGRETPISIWIRSWDCWCRLANSRQQRQGWQLRAATVVCSACPGCCNVISTVENCHDALWLFASCHVCKTKSFGRCYTWVADS